MKLKIIQTIGISVLACIAIVGCNHFLTSKLPPKFSQIALAQPTKSTPLPQTTTLKFQIETFNSKAMGSARKYGVILPPNYNSSPQKHYPVIFLLHGGHDEGRVFYDHYGLAQVLTDLYREDKLPPAIVIMPDGNDQRGSSSRWDPEYFNGSNGNVDTLIGSELVTVVKERYRTRSGANYWAMGGVSSGGWGAVNIGLRHLQTFGTLFSHGGYFTDTSGAKNSPESFVSSLSPAQLKAVHIYLDAGANNEETFFRTSSAQFHQILNNLGISNVFHVFPGGHGNTGADVGWNYFHKHLSDSLSYVGEQFFH